MTSNTGPEERAREIGSQIWNEVDHTDIGDEAIQIIATHLRSYGEEEFKRGEALGYVQGQIDGTKREEKKWIERGLADGFKRGVEEAAKIADEHSGHGCECAYLIRQRGREGRDENISQL